MLKKLIAAVCASLLMSSAVNAAELDKKPASNNAEQAVATSQSANGEDKDIAALRQRLNELYPSSNISSISHTQVDGLYELIAGKNLMYTDKNGKYFIFGSIFDMQTQHDLSADRRDQLNVVDVDALPVADAIHVVHGKGTRKLFVFSDPECPFCKRAEQAMVGWEDVTVYVFLMPIPQLHPDAAQLAENIWCSDNKAKAWTDWMLNGVKPADKKCDNPISRNQALAAGLNARGTPTFIRQDGRVVAGQPNADQASSYITNKKD